MYNNHLSRLLFLFIALSVLTSCTEGKKQTAKETYQFDDGRIFNTSFHIKYAYNRSLKAEIMDELNTFDLSLNPFNKNSIISKVNNNEPVVVDSFFTEVFNKSMEVSGNTDGKFDITASPLINAWGFGFKNMDSITPQIIDSLQSFVGYGKIAIDPDGKIAKTDSRVTLNMSAIAKGYACDVIARLLEKHGIENYMVEIGGEISAKGVNDSGQCWRIGIDKPIDDASGMKHELQTILSICDKAMATSGNYRNYYVKDGKKYTHTIDPQTGFPAQQNILSATVLADQCITADAYATAFMVMGLEKSVTVAKGIPGLLYYFIYSTANDSVAVHYSDGFEAYFANDNQNQ